MSLVSIIIPIYNVEDYVSNAVNSAINQTEKDIEIILVDDGSTDSSGIKCDKFAAKDSRIKVIHKENGGLSSARNAGTKVAKSNYVMYLDGDDFLNYNAVNRLLSVMKEYPSDFIQFNYKEVYPNQTINYTECKFNNKEIYQAHTSRELFENLYKLGGVAASGATKLIKRDLMLKIPFENIQHEDEMWCTRAFQNDLVVTYINDQLYNYVIRENSIIHSKFNEKMMDIFAVCDERIRVLNTLNIDDLLKNEYNRIFQSIVRLHISAKDSNNTLAIKQIKKLFKSYKKPLKKYVNFSGKFSCLFRATCSFYFAIDIYYLFLKFKKCLCRG